jgi:hypothetical protein
MTLRVLDAKSRKVVCRQNCENTVVAAAAEPMCHLLGGDADAANLYAKKMAFGTGTAAPAVTDVSLQRPITPIKDIATVTHPTSSSTLFTATLEADEGNGFPINEVGLMNVNKVLLARVILASPQAKTVDYIFLFEWLIEF